ncbi:MAG: hypothetical protein IPL28_07095 [Chloroflexi bacterium]|nr:hypothetical protein [Chloroflexota bacterium]
MASKTHGVDTCGKVVGYFGQLFSFYPLLGKDSAGAYHKEEQHYYQNKSAYQFSISHDFLLKGGLLLLFTKPLKHKMPTAHFLTMNVGIMAANSIWF